jgi:WD40 repeat protein/TPR repeat protein
MRYVLLLARGDGAAAQTAELEIRELRQFPGNEGLSTHFRPIRSDALFDSAKRSGLLASRILYGEGVISGHLAVEFEVRGPALNVTGRSAELLIALALLLSRWPLAAQRFEAVAATGALDIESGTTMGDDGAAAVQAVQHTVSKVAAAVEALRESRSAVVFYPATDHAAVTAWRGRLEMPPQVHLHPIGTLEDALEILGITLEKTYLGNPFRGLEPFDYAHRSIFFGRDEETASLCQQLLRREAAGMPGVLVEGASGCGKSSFLGAGVLSALIHPESKLFTATSGLKDRPVPEGASGAIWRVGLLPPAATEAKIAASIYTCWQSYPELRTDESPPQTLDALLERWHHRWPAHLRFVWILDQLEELFNGDQGQATIELLGAFLATLQAAGAWSLASIRADAVPLLNPHAGLRQVFGSNEGHFYLETVNPDALDDVIVRPAAAAALSFGPTPSGKPLDEILRHEAYRDAGNALPLLQFTLAELYQRRVDRTLTYEAYAALQGPHGVVSTLASSVLERLPAPGRIAPARLFRELVTLDENGRAMRRYASLYELRDHESLRSALAAFVEARLCISDERDGKPVVSFAHDALLRTWPALVDWLKEEVGLLKARELAERDCRLWEEHERSTDWLASLDKLALFASLGRAELPLPGAVPEFIALSERRMRRLAAIKVMAVSAIVLLAVIASAMGLEASRKAHEAEYQAMQARQAQSRLLTEAAAQRLKGSDVAAAQAIILEVLTNARIAQGRTPAAINVFQEVRASDAQLAILSGHSDFLRSAAYSPDGMRVVTASLDKTARIWDARSGKQLAVLSGHGDRVNSAAYSPDGTQIVTASSDKTARIWDARTGAQLAILSGNGDRLISAAYSPDGTRIVTASYGRTARVMDTRTGAMLAALSGHGATVTSAAYSPDGSKIVTASFDHSARIWDARSGKQLAELTGHGGTVEFAAYSPDGMRIVTASADKTARIWNARTGAQLTVLSGHGGTVESVAYSPDGMRVVTASDDKTVRIWDAHTGAQLTVLSGHGDRVAFAAYSPDGARIITASVDQTARIWDARMGAQLALLSGHKDFVRTAEYSPDGNQIVTASFDQTARTWDAHSAAQLAVLAGHGDRVISAAYSPDGSRIATASDDQTARIWDSRTGAQLTILSGHGATIESAAFSPDGTRVVTASFDQTARIWDSRTGSQLTVLSGHRATVESAAYSPDGNQIVTASDDNTARVWNARTGVQLAVLTGHGAAVESAAYSADGRRIVTASDDKTARVWDARTGAQLTVLSGHGDRVLSATYSPDSTRIVTASVDETARIWDARTGAQLGVLFGHDAMVASAAYAADGTRIVTASADKTARIWDARVPANIATQIAWYASAQSDPLSDIDRIELGLGSDARKEAWSREGSACDRSAAAFYDPNRLAQGVSQARLNAEMADRNCSLEVAVPDHAARTDYQMGRALLAKRDINGAKRQLELAVSKGYPVARVDLANLLIDQETGTPDAARAVSLYESAWQDGVQIAAFQLGELYESGLGGSERASPVVFRPDPAKAWFWYQKGADAGEPNALARFADRDESGALTEGDRSKSNLLLLRAFSRYASASERAKKADWPDEEWRYWRYRRATLARLLAREGLMQDVGDAFVEVQKRAAP